jgi:hypothetical protein
VTVFTKLSNAKLHGVIVQHVASGGPAGFRYMYEVA